MKKDLNISKDILKDIFIDPDIRYKGLRIEVTIAAMRELRKYTCDLHLVKKVLEAGYDCSASKRKSNIVERCQRKGNKEIKVVIAFMQSIHPDGSRETIWKLIHFGMVTYKKQKYKGKK